MSDRTYPELNVDEMLSEASSPEDSPSTTPTTDADGEPDVKGYSQGRLPVLTLGITAIVVASLLAVFGIWEYFPSNKQQLREAESRVEKLEARNAALAEQLKTQEAVSQLSEREIENQKYTQEVMLKDIRTCAEILRPYGGDD